MESHKRILGILYLVWGLLTLLLVFGINVFISFMMFHTNTRELDLPEMMMVEGIVRVIMGFVLLVISLPSIIGGIGMLYDKKWAFTIILIVGIFSLMSFPMGTAIGVYTLWAYFKDQEIQKGRGKEETFEKRSN